MECTEWVSAGTTEHEHSAFQKEDHRCFTGLSGRIADEFHQITSSHVQPLTSHQTLNVDKLLESRVGAPIRARQSANLRTGQSDEPRKCEIGSSMCFLSHGQPRFLRFHRIVNAQNGGQR